MIKVISSLGTIEQLLITFDAKTMMCNDVSKHLFSVCYQNSVNTYYVKIRLKTTTNPHEQPK